MAAGEDSVSTSLGELPAYRQLRGGGHLYRITAPDRFMELQRIGGRWVLHEVHAQAYPERVRVHEMLLCEGPFELLPEARWQEAMSICRPRS